MNIRFLELHLAFKKSKELIVFQDFNCFHGQMGAGKSSIVRLMDFCLGGDLGGKGFTPALQNEFVSGTLILLVGSTTLQLYREIGSTRIRASWDDAQSQYDIIVPVKQAASEVLPGTGVEVISDLFYFIEGGTSPRVPRSKHKEASELVRLSFRNLMWFCYLDQDSMDSSFFHLERDGNNWKRLQAIAAMAELATRQLETMESNP